RASCGQHRRGHKIYSFPGQRCQSSGLFERPDAAYAGAGADEPFSGGRIMDMRNTLKTLCQAYGRTGNEGSVAQVIREMVAPVADEMTTDAMGNLIVTKKGRGQGRLMMAAHMDEIGLMVTYVE